MDNIQKILLDECLGCEACAQICPFNAIKMIEREEDGFFIPIVDSHCVFCGKCLNVCPVNNKPVMQNVGEVCYAGILNEFKVLKNSASGGAFPAIVNVLGDGLIVFGAKYDENLKVIHSSSKGNDILKFQGSKYVQSQIGNSYVNVKHHLDNGKKVLFTGTPCQIVALKLFLGKEYDHLFCVEIICHGVGSPGLFARYIEELSIKQGSKVISYNFRNKNSLKGGWRDFVTRVEYENGKISNTRYDPFTRTFLGNYLLRKSCYNCRFRGWNRSSDIVIADFWGIENIKKLCKAAKNGVSLVMPVTEKGKKICSSLSKYMVMYEVKTEYAIMYNRQFIQPTFLPGERDLLFEKYFHGANITKLLLSVSGEVVYWKRFLSYFYNMVIR